MSKLDRTGERGRFLRARKAEANYNGKLRGVARQVDKIVKALAPGGYLRDPDLLDLALGRYSELLQPWARSVAGLMLADVSRRDEKAWIEHSKTMSRGLRAEILNAPTGAIMGDLMSSQVELITSLPLQAAERVHDLVTTATYSGRRAEQIAQEILRTGAVTESRARLIARTEVSRAQSNLTEARARYVGSDGYIWRTSKDGGVRDSHKEMEGKYVRWGSPPTLDGLVGHAGCLPNCRCWAEPVIPDFADI